MGAHPSAVAAEPVHSSPSMDKDRNRIFDALDGDLKHRGEAELVEAIVLLSRHPSRQLIEQQRGDVGDFDIHYRYRTLPAYSGLFTKRQVKKLATRSEIVQIQPQGRMRASMNTARTAFGVDKAVTDFSVDGDSGADGAKIYGPADAVIAVVDTGIDAGHIDLDGGKVLAFQDCTGVGGCTTATASDGNGHGTHVASIAAGEGDANPSYKGVAPAAALVGVKVLDDAGNGTTAGVDAGIEWVIANKARYGIDVMNVSLGSAGNTDGTDTTSRLVNRATAGGIAVFVAAGNEGPRSHTIGSPGSAKFVTTLGAMSDPMDAQGSDPKGFALGDFSSRGPTFDGRQKPDIAAAGVDIGAANAGSTNTYVAYSGTSMATPFAAGVGALMLQADPSLAPSGTSCATGNNSPECRDGVVDSTMLVPYKATMMATAQDWGPPGGDSEFGAGRLDAYAAIDAASPVSGAGGPPVPPHGFFCGNLAAQGNTAEWPLPVSSTEWPIAITFIMPSWSGTTTPDLDVELLNPLGSVVGASEGPTRQETIGFQPTVTGTYVLAVSAFRGSGTYWVDTSGPIGVEVLQSDPRGTCSTQVNESGQTDTYSLSLVSAPTSTVTVEVASDAQVQLSSSTLEFTPSNWSSPRTVTVTAVDDDIDEPSPIASVLSHSVTSLDPRYDNIAVADVSVSVVDDDTAGITFTQSSGSTRVTETSTTSDSYSLRLSSQPTADVTVTVTPDPQQTATPASFVFTPADWATDRTVTVTAINDSLDESFQHVGKVTHVFASADGVYTALVPPVLAVTVVDNDVSGYWVESQGAVHPFGGASEVVGGPSFSFDIARGVVALPGDDGGYVMDGYGGMHPFAPSGKPAPPLLSGLPYFPGFDIGRDTARYPAGPGIYILDGFGGIHPAGGAPKVNMNATVKPAYFPGYDIARAIAIKPSSDGGFLMDGRGGVHPFGLGANQAPGYASGLPYFSFDIARDIVLLADGQAGYILDGYGGIHPFSLTASPPPPEAVGAPYRAGRDEFKGLLVLDDATGGYVFDRDGIFYRFSFGPASMPPAMFSPGASGPAGRAVSSR